MGDFLLSLELNVKLIVAGLLGGIVHTFFFKQTDPYTILGSVVSGMFTSNYLAPTIAHLTGYSEGACGFVAGFGAMALCAAIVNTIKLKLGVKE